MVAYSGKDGTGFKSAFLLFYYPHRIHALQMESSSPTIRTTAKLSIRYLLTRQVGCQLEGPVFVRQDADSITNFPNVESKQLFKERATCIF